MSQPQNKKNKVLGKTDNKVNPAGDKRKIPDQKQKQAGHHNPHHHHTLFGYITTRKDIVKNLSKTTYETWITFAFTFIVGTFLLGGGMYLIYDGVRNNVVDLIVVGSCGVVMGVCFSIAGIFLIFRPIYHDYKDKKRRHEEERMMRLQEQQEIGLHVEQAPLTNNSSNVKLLALKAGNELVNPQPTVVDIYDCAADSRNHSASSYASSYAPPPLLAVPNKKKDSIDVKNAVTLMNVRQSTEDDIEVISTLHERKKNNEGPRGKNDTSASSKPAPSKQTLSAGENSGAKPVKTVSEVSDPPTREEGSRTSSAQSATRRHSPHDRHLGSPSPIEVTVTVHESRARQSDGSISPDFLSRESTNVGESVSDEDVPAKKKRVLSALNERKSATGSRQNVPAHPLSPQGSVSDIDDAFDVVDNGDNASLGTIPKEPFHYVDVVKSESGPNGRDGKDIVVPVLIEHYSEQKGV